MIGTRASRGAGPDDDMAPWALMKLLHPFTAEDLLVSQKILSSVNLPASTSQFVLALTDPRSPQKVVYVLAVEKLSERSVDDINSLVAAVNPNSVVAFVDAQYLTEVVDEEKLLDSPESLDVPTSLIDVIKFSFVEKIKVGGYESRAGLRVLLSVFGTTFYGNVFAAKRAAEGAQAVFQYLRLPSVAIASFSDEEEYSEGTAGRIELSKVSYADRFLSGFTGFLGGNNLEYLNGVSQQDTLSRISSRPEELTTLASSVASVVTSKVAGFSFSPADSSPVPSSAIDEHPEDVEDDCPFFAVPFYPLFVDLHHLFKETPGVNQALRFSRNLLNSVDRGDEVDLQDLSRARLFRVAVESIRLSWNSFVRKEHRVSSKLTDFSQLPFEEKCQALLARALQHQVQKFSTVVAIVDASSVPGIRKHWNTPVPPEVAAYTEYCFVALDSKEIGEGGKPFNILESPESKAAVVVSAGAVAAAGLVSLPQWASVPTFVKVFSFKVPTVLKLVWMQMKRMAVVSWTAPASKAVMTVLKAAGSGKVALAPSSTAKAVLMKSVVSAEKARATAHGVVAAAERASLQAIRTSFYSLMRSRQAKNLGARPWLALGGSLAAAGSVLWYGEEMEHAISIVPSAPGVVRLGRGLEKLDQASKIVNDYEGSGWWVRVYDTLYRQSHRH